MYFFVSWCDCECVSVYFCDSVMVSVFVCVCDSVMKCVDNLYIFVCLCMRESCINLHFLVGCEKCSECDSEI